MRFTRAGKVLFANKSSRVFLDAWDNQPTDQAPPDWENYIEEAYTAGKYREVDVKCGPRVFSCIFTPLIEDGYINMYATDVTERERTRAALQTYTEELEKTHRELQEFISIASHDLQEPLRKIITLSGMIQNEDGVTQNPTVKDYLRRLSQASDRMQQMVDALSDYAHIAANHDSFIKLSLNDPVARAMEEMQGSIESTSASIIIEPLPSAEIAPDKIKSLITAILENSLKFHPRNHCPEIKISGSLYEKGWFSTQPYIKIVIEDRGIGFDQRYQHQLFKPFSRLVGRDEFPGSGMGLAICRKIVEQHGGAINIEGSQGVGTRVIIHLPQRHHIN
jgi:light-regulated signal transduction histidine kinase (bacteriophytochrome)